MDKVKLFLKSTRISSRILFGIWLVADLSLLQQRELQPICGVMFLLPALMTEFRKNIVFAANMSNSVRLFRNTKVVSRILLYLWILFIAADEFDIIGIVISSVMFLLPATLIERFTNPMFSKIR